MQKLFFLLAISIFVASCSKDKMLDNEPENATTQVRTIYTPSSLTYTKDCHTAMAYAVSKYTYTNPAFKTWLITHMVRETMTSIHSGGSNPENNNNGGGNTSLTSTNQDPVRMKDLLVYDVFPSGQFRTEINVILRELPIYASVTDPIASILACDNLISFNMPIDLVTSCNLEEEISNNINASFPIIVSDFDERHDFIFDNGELFYREFDGFYACGIYITTAIYIRKVNKVDETLCDGTRLSLIYGEEVMECPSVGNAIASKPSFPLTPSCVLVDIYTDILQLFDNNCIDPAPNPPSGGASFPPAANCYRAEKDIEYNTNINWIDRFTNISWATFFDMDNQPCDITEGVIQDGEAEFKILVQRVFAENGQPLQNVRQLIKPFIRSQMIYSGLGKTVWFIAPNWKLRLIPKITRETVLNPTLWDKMPYVRDIELYTNLFVDYSNSQNIWLPEDRGDIVKILMYEVDSKTCTQSITDSKEFSTSGEIKFGYGVKDSFDGSVSVKWDRKESYKMEYKIQGKDIVPVAEFEVSYCQNPYYVAANSPSANLTFFRSSSFGVNSTYLITREWWFK